MADRGNNQRTAARTRKRRARSYRLIRAFIVVILLCVAFAGGFVVRGQSGFLQSLGFPSAITGIPQSETTEQAVAKKDVYNSLSTRIAEVEDILATDSLDTYNLDEVTESTFSAFGSASKR